MKKNFRILLTILFACTMQHGVAQTEMSLGELLHKTVTDNTKGYLVTAKLVEATGLQPELCKIQDETYERMYQSGAIPTEITLNYNSCQAPAHRKYGYTIFAEPDTYWEKVLGKSVANITVTDVKNYIVKQGACPGASTDENFTDEANVLRQFVGYHILPMRLTPDSLVIHWNEKGHDRYDSQKTIPVWGLYSTMGQRRLLKIYEGGAGDPEGIFLNRFPKLDNGMHGTYHEVSCDASKKGIAVDTAKAVTATNGMLYGIDDILLYNQATAENLQSQRLRFDVVTMFPELINNGIRLFYDKTDWWIPSNNVYKYVEGLDVSDATIFTYLPGIGYSWHNLNGDEFNITGDYDFTIQLPSVPVSGEYELRVALQNNSTARGMAMMYWGDDKNNLRTVSVPVDMRVGGKTAYVGWKASTGNDKADRLVDVQMHHKGFMKGPEAYHAGSATASTARNTQTTTRRIIVREYMEAGKTYYLRVKNALKRTDREFYLDYIELCSDKVYANPDEPEDIW